MMVEVGGGGALTNSIYFLSCYFYKFVRLAPRKVPHRKRQSFLTGAFLREKKSLNIKNVNAPSPQVQARERKLIFSYADIHDAVNADYIADVQYRESKV